MQPVPIDSLDDPRISAYRNLKDRHLTADDGRFIVEGTWVVRRLLKSDFPTDSVLVSDKNLDSIRSFVPDAVSLYVAGDQMVNQIVGFKFHGGVIACGRRKPPVSLDQLLPESSDKESPLTVVVCPQLIDHENLGLIVRLCAPAF